MNQTSVKIGIALREDQHSDEGWVNGVIDAARRSLQISPLNLNVNVDVKTISITIEGRGYHFMEECFDNDEATIKRVAMEIANQGIPVYYGDVYFRVPAIQHVFKKAIVVFANGHARSDGYAVTRSIVDTQCGIEFPTGVFSDNPQHAVFTSLGLELPMAYSTFMQTINNKVAVNFPGARLRAASTMTREESKFIENFLVLASKASKIYPMDMIWTDEVLPLPIQTMEQKVSVSPVGAFQFIDREDAVRLGISHHAGLVSMIEAEGNVTSSTINMMNDIGNLLQPGTNEDFADAMRSMLMHLNESQARGNDFTVSKVSPRQLVIELRPSPTQTPPQPRNRQHRRNVRIEDDDFDGH